MISIFGNVIYYDDKKISEYCSIILGQQSLKVKEYESQKKLKNSSDLNNLNNPKNLNNLKDRNELADLNRED